MKLAVPCHVEDPDMWFAENPAELERAKALCADCPIRRECLAAALEREEPWGVWGGEILDRGTIIARKRPRGRPRKNTAGEPGSRVSAAGLSRVSTVRQAASSAKPGISSVASALAGTCASSWQEIATLDAMTRIGIASFAGMSIWRAALI